VDAIVRLVRETRKQAKRTDLPHLRQQST
jgi:hypothetical protein